MTLFIFKTLITSLASREPLLYSKLIYSALDNNHITFQATAFKFGW